MKKETLGMLLALVGGVALLIAAVKFVVIGYYPEEVAFFAILAAAGAALCWSGSRVYQAGKQEG